MNSNTSNTFVILSICKPRLYVVVVAVDSRFEK